MPAIAGLIGDSTRMAETGIFRYHALLGVSDVSLPAGRSMATTRDLKILAATVWYVGAIAMALKAIRLLTEAARLNPAGGWIVAAVASGLALGALQGKFLFVHFGRMNLERIDRLPRPRIWQFFRGRFLFALTLMILTGVALSRVAHGRYPLLIAVAAIDIIISTSLLVSSTVFWIRSGWSQRG